MIHRATLHPHSSALGLRRSLTFVFLSPHSSDHLKIIYIETSRLAAIIDLVRSMELENTTVAFCAGVNVSTQMLVTLVGKLAFGLFLASQ